VADDAHRVADVAPYADARGCHRRHAGARHRPSTFFQSYDLVVRAADPIALVPAIQRAIWGVDRDQALGTPELLEGYVRRTLRPRRLLTEAIGVFAASALLLAAFGVYGDGPARARSRVTTTRRFKP
jgi:hypothetical protein